MPAQKITEAEENYKSRMQRKRTKAEMQKEKCRNDIRTPRMNEEKYAEYRYKRKRFPAYAEFMKIS